LSAWQRQERSGREPFAFADWSPVVDICETDDEYSIKAEIPEVDKKNLNVTVQNGVLSIQGERKREKEEKGKRFHRIERSYGSFAGLSRSPEMWMKESSRPIFMTAHS